MRNEGGKIMAGGPYQIPRNLKGEGKILFIFSTKALIYTAVGTVIGIIFYYILKMIGLGMVGLGIMAILALMGFVIGTFKIPDTNAFEVTRKTGGENIDDVIMRAIKFKHKKRKIYVYIGGKKDE